MGDRIPSHLSYLCTLLGLQQALDARLPLFISLIFSHSCHAGSAGLIGSVISGAHIRLGLFLNVRAHYWRVG